MTEDIKKILLLLVDDDEVDREMIRKSLSILDADIDECATSEEFFKVVRKRPYDLILLDYKLPDDTGINVAKKVRGMGITTPMILITGFGSEELYKEGVAAGLLGYITKDKVTPQVIIQIILGAFVQYKVELESLQEKEKQQEEERKKVVSRLDYINKILKEKIAYYDSMDGKKP